MENLDISTLKDDEKVKLTENRWTSSSVIWDTIDRIYTQNTSIYENQSYWLSNFPYRMQNWLVQANRIFVNMEAVINSLIANPPGINILSTGKTAASQEFSAKLENYFRKKYNDRNIKETVRMGYRNLYFGRLFVIKPFWNPVINDFDYRALDPRKVRFGKYARKEQDSEFAIEEIEDNLCAVIDRFPKKKDELMKMYGFNSEAELYIKNPDVTYKEAWIGEYVIFILSNKNLVLDTIKNPYWDWDGILVTPEEEQQIMGTAEIPAVQGDARRQLLQQIKLDQTKRQPSEPQEGVIEEAQQPQYKKYYYNYFDSPRKPYIFATILNNENKPIGRTDFITLSSTLQRGIDKRKTDIGENCDMVNGILKVDAGVMPKSDAQRIRFETKGIIWGKGVKDGVTRETGQGLPQMVFDDMLDSRQEIDNIMAASSAFRGEREGQETKAGRLALIQQSFLRLNELVQLGDYVHKEIFDWGMQLSMNRYTEYHEAKWKGEKEEQEVIEIIQDDFEKGAEVTIIAGKTLPVDDEWRFEQAQNDFEKGALGLVDYLRASKYDNPKDLAKNAVAWQINKPISVGMTPEELQEVQPPQTEEKPPNVSISYADLPPDAKVQLLGKIGIEADPNIIIAKDQAELAEKAAEHKVKQVEMGMKVEAQAHAQKMAEKSQETNEKKSN